MVARKWNRRGPCRAEVTVVSSRSKEDLAVCRHLEPAVCLLMRPIADLPCLMIQLEFPALPTPSLHLSFPCFYLRTAFGTRHDIINVILDLTTQLRIYSWNATTYQGKSVSEMQKRQQSQRSTGRPRRKPKHSKNYWEREPSEISRKRHIDGLAAARRLVKIMTFSTLKALSHPGASAIILERLCNGKACDADGSRVASAFGQRGSRTAWNTYNLLFRIICANLFSRRAGMSELVDGHGYCICFAASTRLASSWWVGQRHSTSRASWQTC